MINIEQNYSEFTMKYNELKLITYEIFEQGKKTLNGKNFECIGSSFINKKKLLNAAIDIDKDLLEKELVEIDSTLRRQGKSLLVYIKKRTEKISVNEIIDYREFSFVRVVIRRNQATPIIEETYPKSITLSSVIDFVNNIIKIEITKEITSVMHRLNLINTRLTLLPQAAGFFIHEAIGHLLEEDIYNFFKDQLDHIKFPLNFSLIDNPIGYEKLIGVNRYDDFGQLIKPILLIKDGKIQNTIKLNNGFARSEKFDHKPLPRMRMLILENVQEEELSKKKCSIFISKIHSGQVTPADFTFRLKGEGYIIEDQTVRRKIQNIEIQGDLKKSIESIDYIGNKPIIFSADCTKYGQTIRVGAKTPSISFICRSIEGEIHE